MAALTITPANVAIDSEQAIAQVVQAGEAITQGDPYYISSGKAYVADAAGTQAEATVAGIAMTKASADGDYILGVSSGKIIPGASLTKGVLYYLGQTGDIVPFADLVSGDYVVPLFRAEDTATAVMEISNPNIEL